MKKFLWRIVAVLLQTLGNSPKKEDDTAVLRHPNQSARTKRRRNRRKK